MNHIKLINKVKYSKVLYKIYFYVGSALLKLCGMLLPADDKLILFTSYGGRGYNDSPKAIYEMMRMDARFSSYRFAWAFIQPEKFDIPQGIKVKIDTVSFFLNACKARCWITNSSMTRGLSFTGKRTFYYNSLHGTPIKTMGTKIKEGNQSFHDNAGKGGERVADCYSAQSALDIERYSSDYNIPREAFLLSGFPRNDVLARSDMIARKKARDKLKISDRQRVILYVPTFREYERDDHNNCVFKSHLDIKKVQKALSGEYLWLLRLHYEIVEGNDAENAGLLNVTAYQDINDLYIAADLLISDYSSAMVDYSILGKPIIAYIPDIVEYEKRRGLNIDIRDELCYAVDEDSLVGQIAQVFEDEKSLERNISKVRRFKGKYVEACGDGSSQVIDAIWNKIASHTKK